MRKKPNIRSIFLSIFLTGLVFSFSGRTTLAATDDAIIAVVNDEIITLKDFREYLNARYMQMVAEGKTEEEIQKKMLDLEISGINELVDDKLLLDLANKKEMEIRGTLIDERIEKIRSKFDTEQEFLDALMADGLTVSDLKKKITDQLKSQYVIEMEVKNKIFVNPQEVTEFYKMHFNEFKEAEKIELESIFIAFEKRKEKAFQKAKEAQEDLGKGTEFAEAVKKYSDAPSIGIVTRGQLLPALEKSIFKLKVGETSPLIETENGIYIFKAKQKFPAKVASMNDVKENIYNRIFFQKFQERLKEWLAQLRSKAYIEIKT